MSRRGCEERLSSISIDPDRALLEWLQALGGRVSGRVLASSGTFQYFAAAAPGAKELVAMVKVWQLTRGGGRRTGSGGYDLVVLDAPATGHALGMLGSPQTFGTIARVGPIAGQTRQVQELLENPSHTAYLAVALGTEMAVTEALELQDGLRRQLRRSLAAVVVNALLPRRFTAAELRRIVSLSEDAARSGGDRRERRGDGGGPDGAAGRDRLGRAGSPGRSRPGALPAQPTRAPASQQLRCGGRPVRVGGPAGPGGGEGHRQAARAQALRPAAGQGAASR